MHCDCMCDVVPPMPVIKAMSAKDAYELPHTHGSFGKLFSGYSTDALTEGVVSIEDACNVQPQQVTTDAELVPSVIRFATDGSPVLVLYQGGCCEPDPVREDRVGGRGILNAFRLVSLEDAALAWDPDPADSAENVSPNATLSWQPGLYADSHDVYLGTDFDAVQDANTAETLGVYMARQDACEHDPCLSLELCRTYYWRVDEVNDANVCKGWVWSFTVDDGKATYLSPANGSADIARDMTLSWSPGLVAGSHDVYLGTDFDDVSDGNTSSPEYKGNQPLGADTYDPCGLLELGVTYYWRIDEVNPAYADSKGDVWSFTVTDYIVVDDMESYNTSDNMIGDTWLGGGYYNWTGAWLHLWVDPCEPVHAGQKSMKYDYDNTGGWWGDLHYYSEVARTFADPCDWSVSGIKVLTLYFYGDPDNDANAGEQAYVGLQDSNGPDSYAEVRYGHYGEDMNNIKSAEWRQWNIALSDFNDVNLACVEKVYIGFGDRSNLYPGGTPGGSGTVYFDDIRLYSRKCAPEFASVADLSGNCIVDV
ncbi:MAG: hypothetical protein ACYS21_19745, partial [Planctomycetota bacterium]